LSTLVCGRCGNRTAPNSTYCPHDRWTLWLDPPEGDPRIGAAIASLEVPRGLGGLLDRMRLDKHRAQLERELESTLDKRIQELEERLESEPADFEAHRRLGILTLLRHHYERAHAHLKRAHELNPHDFETHINYAIVLAQRGQLQPSLEILNAAHKQWPGTPLVLFNLALIALQARRANVVLEAVSALEALWQKNPAIAAEYREDGLSARGLALLLLNRNDEAYVALHAAAGGTAASSQAANGSAPPASTRDGAGSGAHFADNDGDASPDADDDGLDDVTAAERRQLIHAVETFGNTHPSPEQAATAQSATAQAATTQAASERRREDRRVAPPDVPWPYEDRRQSPRRQAQPADVVSSGAAPAAAPAPLAVDSLVVDDVKPDADRLNNLAIAEAAAGHYDRAVARLGAAMRLEPGNTRIHNNLGVLAYQQGNLRRLSSTWIWRDRLKSMPGSASPKRTIIWVWCCRRWARLKRAGRSSRAPGRTSGPSSKCGTTWAAPLSRRARPIRACLT
jgi:tetratricopeptide (TPR) repeat protein